MNSLRTEKFLFCLSLRTGTSLILWFTLLLYHFLFCIALSILMTRDSLSNATKVVWVGASLVCFVLLGYIPRQTLAYFPEPGEHYVHNEPHVKYMKYFASYYCVLSVGVMIFSGVATMLSSTYLKEVRNVIFVIDIVLPGIFLHFTAVIYSFYLSLLSEENSGYDNNNSEEQMESEV